MNIEISDKKYWKKMNYDDGKLYCSLLTIDGKNDWEFPKHNKSFVRSLEKIDEHREYYACWFIEDDDVFHGYKYWVIPVRYY